MSKSSSDRVTSPKRVSILLKFVCLSGIQIRGHPEDQNCSLFFLISQWKCSGIPLESSGKDTSNKVLDKAKNEFNS